MGFKLLTQKTGGKFRISERRKDLESVRRSKDMCLPTLKPKDGSRWEGKYHHWRGGGAHLEEPYFRQ